MQMQSAQIITRCKGYSNEHEELDLTIPGFVGTTYEFLYEKKVHEDKTYYMGRHFFLPLCRGFLQTNNHNGYGGWTFPVDLANGGTDTLRGPWSSRPACFMAMGFPHYIEVSINKTTGGFGMYITDLELILPETHFIGGEYFGGEFSYKIERK